MAPHHLHGRFQTFPIQRSTQHIVTGDDLLQRLAESVQPRTVGKCKARLQAIGVIVAGRQIMVENTGLQWPQRVDVLNIGRAACHAGNHAINARLIQLDQWQQVRGDRGAIRTNQVGRNLHLAAAANRAGQGGERRLSEQHAHIGVHAPATHARNQGDGQQRMPAQFKEVVVPPHLLDLQQVAPDLGQRGFQFALWRFVVASGQGLAIRCRQGAAIHFAIGGQRPGIKAHKSVGDHVPRQTGEHVAAQLRRCHRGAVGTFDEVRHQTRLPRFVFAGHDQRFFNARQLRQLRLDFAQLDTHTTNLHLIVVTTQIIQRAICVPARQIASTVHARMRLPGKRIEQEALGSQLRLVQVTACHAFATDVQLTGDAQRHQLLLIVQQIHTGIGDRLADVEAAIGQ